MKNACMIIHKDKNKPKNMLQKSKTTCLDQTTIYTWNNLRLQPRANS